MRYVIAIIALVLFVAGLSVVEAAFFDLPPLPPAEEYGNILINRVSSANNVKPVGFSHWQHRLKYTCRVCHSELGFNMKANTTDITEMANRKGKYCGACHNGKIAFRHNGNCDKCHNGNIAYANKKFDVFFKSPFARTSFGDGINWVESLSQGTILPARYVKTKSQDITFDKMLVLDSEMNIIPPSIFPHKAHTAWLDCDSCHPEIFNIKKKTTRFFSMSYILKGEFCGVCHLNVAFPMDDCRRCHPGIRE
jgi:c(7)-type cytochrome triheme protein